MCGVDFKGGKEVVTGQAGSGGRKKKKKKRRKIRKNREKNEQDKRNRNRIVKIRAGTMNEIGVSL